MLGSELFVGEWEERQLTVEEDDYTQEDGEIGLDRVPSWTHLERRPCSHSVHN